MVYIYFFVAELEFLEFLQFQYWDIGIVGIPEFECWTVQSSKFKVQTVKGQQHKPNEYELFRIKRFSFAAWHLVRDFHPKHFI